MHMNDYDSAYQCYKTVASRYPSASTLDEKIQGLDGIYGTLECNILMSDYRSAFDDLLLAEEIVNKNKLPKIRLNLYYGDFYIVLGSQTGKQSFLQMAVPYNRDAFNEALQANDDVAIYCAFGNLMNCCYVLNDLKKHGCRREENGASGSYQQRLALRLFAASAEGIARRLSRRGAWVLHSGRETHSEKGI